jgi:hypothetical protein
MELQEPQHKDKRPRDVVYWGQCQTGAFAMVAFDAIYIVSGAVWMCRDSVVMLDETMYYLFLYETMYDLGSVISCNYVYHWL